MATLLLYLALLLVALLVWTLALWLGGRLARIPGATLVRALLAIILLAVVAVLLNLAAFAVANTSGVPQQAWAPAALALYLVAGWFVTKWVFRTSWPRTLLAWPLGFVMGFALGLALAFGLAKPYLLEAYVMPNAAMSPTLLGPHRIGTCPACGGPLLLPAEVDPMSGTWLPLGEELGICEACLQVTTAKPSSPTVWPEDRFLCNKLLHPRRWDLVVFRSPQDPRAKLVKRLVGLPGEQVVIKDGAIWINGKEMQPPPEIAKLRFEAAPDTVGGVLDTWGSPSRPAQLSEEEYFVIGDFSQHSVDSRTWRKGAVPRSRVEGVVTLIYWPTPRCHVFR